MSKKAAAKKGLRAAEARAVATGATVPASPAPGPLKLQREESDGTVGSIARSLRRKRPDLGEDPSDTASASYLAASFIAYAFDKNPQTPAQWCKVLGEVLEDARVTFEEDETDNDEAIGWVIEDLRSKSVLLRKEPQIDVGSVVLALLEEDQEWHEAGVEEDLGDGTFRVRFFEYGKPQKTASANICQIDTIVNDEDTEDAPQEGECEMCHRRMLLTFHHLIPKDTHPTYLKKPAQLASVGIHGDPTRSFLNSYGTMVCGRCHSNIHQLAPNAVLAKEYNTLEKILAQPRIQSWIEWAAKQTPHGTQRRD